MVGGVAVVALAVVEIYFLRYRSRKKRRDAESVGSKSASDTPLGAMTAGSADYNMTVQVKAELPAFEDDPTKHKKSHLRELETDDLASHRTSQAEELGQQRALLIHGVGSK